MVQFYNMDSEDDDHDQQPAASSDGLAYVVDRRQGTPQHCNQNDAEDSTYF